VLAGWVATGAVLPEAGAVVPVVVPPAGWVALDGLGVAAVPVAPGAVGAGAATVAFGVSRRVKPTKVPG